MTQPIQVDLPHHLGKDEARRRIAANIGSLKNHIPGGANVASSWAGDTLNLDIGAMGQTVAASIEVMESNVRVRVTLPGLLGMFAGPIQALMQQKGSDLLLDDKRKG